MTTQAVETKARERAGILTEVEACRLATRCAELLREAAQIGAGLEALSTVGAFRFAGGLAVDAATGNAERLERVVADSVRRATRRYLGGAS